MILVAVDYIFWFEEFIKVIVVNDKYDDKEHEQLRYLDRGVDVPDLCSFTVSTGKNICQVLFFYNNFEFIPV